MGVDFLHLECVHGIAPRDVARVVIETLGAQGWSRGRAPRGGTAREIMVGERPRWTVVVDEPSAAPIPWAKTIAGTLGCTAVCFHGWSDQGAFAIERYDGRRRQAVRYPSSERPPRRSVRLRVPWLVDLAPTRARKERLERGIAVPPHDSDGALQTLAKLAGVPEPMDRYVALAPPFVRLRFHRFGPVVAAPAPSPRVRRAVAAPRGEPRDSYHVRGVTRAALVAAVERRLRQRGIVPVEGRRAVDRDVTFVDGGAWQSFGEALRTSHPFGLSDSPAIPWGAALSVDLGVPVLKVRASGDGMALAVFTEGAAGRVVEIAGGKPSVDARPLAAMAPHVDRATFWIKPGVPTPAATFAAAIAERLGLRDLVLRSGSDARAFGAR